MTAIPATNISSLIAPFTTEDTYASHDSKYGKGGWREVATTAERDAITTQRRTAGMAVYVTGENKVYILNDDLTTWTEFETGKIDKIQKNGTDLPITNKTVNVEVPVKISDLTDDTSTNPIDKADTLTGLTATVTELNYTDGVTSNIQTQLNNKVTKNADITGATKTKITYDSKGLVTGGADLQASDIPDLSSNYVTLGTEQKITNKKQMVYSETYPAAGAGGQESILKVLSSHSDSDMYNHAMWCGRLVVGNKNRTFLMGVYNDWEAQRVNTPVCGLGAHSWTNSETDEGAAWEDMHMQPAGNGKGLYVGGNGWRRNTGWFKVINNNSSSAGFRTSINTGTFNSPTWRTVLPNMTSGTGAVFFSPYVYDSATYNYCVSMGMSAVPTGSYATNIGYNAKAGTNGVALGYNAQSTSSFGIQIGPGTNSTDNTMSVGLSESLNVQLLASNGKIPNDRLNIDTTATSGSTNTISSGAVYDIVGNIESALDTIRGV